MQTSTRTPTSEVANLEKAAELIAEVYDAIHPRDGELRPARLALNAALLELGTASGILKVIGLLPSVRA